MLKTCVCVAMFGATSVAFVSSQVETDASSPLRLVATVAMPAVAGRIDHLALEPARQRLFVAALGNDSVEVIDTARNMHLRSLPGFHEPQGVAVLTDLNAVAIANGESGTLQLLDAATLQTRWTINIGGDADNVRYDAAAKRVLVAYQGGIAVVDPAAARVVQRIQISGHPESFQLESQGTRLFANVPGASEVIAADRSTVAVSGSLADRRMPGQLSDGARRGYAPAVDRLSPAGIARALRHDGRKVAGCDPGGWRYRRSVL